MVVNIISRKAWGALPAKDPSRPLSSFVGGWFWHWNGPVAKLPKGSTQSAVAAFLRGVQKYHQGTMGWNDFAYSFAVDMDGRIYEGRGWGIRGAHTDGWNDRAMAVFFVLGQAPDGTEEQPTPEAIQAAEDLMTEGLTMGYSNQLVRPHSDVADKTHTDCPGDSLREYLHHRSPSKDAAVGPFKCTHPLGCEGEIQQVLSNLSDQLNLPQLDPGKVDGKIGPKTAQAVHSLKNLHLQVLGLK